jgi:hypothetical protein
MEISHTELFSSVLVVSACHVSISFFKLACVFIGSSIYVRISTNVQTKRNISSTSYSQITAAQTIIIILIEWISINFIYSLQYFLIDLNLV